MYLSPCLKAAAGSMHGYDVVDPSEVDPKLGGQEGFDRLCQVSAAFGIGLVLDIVPNHMAVAGRQNPWWWDVLTKGIESRYSGFFDILWDHPDLSVNGKILLPVLGDTFKHCLESRQIQIRRNGQELYLAYFEHEFPISTQSRADFLQADGGVSASDASIASINADPERLNRFLDGQHYRLAYWRQANQNLNYRRFFDIHQLAGMCVEKEDVFTATHELVLKWVNEGLIEGLRIDHPDGLRDPALYLEQLRKSAPHAWIVVEKILEPGETLVPDWPVDGTTGYDFLNRVNGLFVNAEGERCLTDFYGEFTGQETDYQEVVHAKKQRVLERLFSSELTYLEALLENILRQWPGFGTFRPGDCRRILSEVIACFPVYRTYIRPGTGTVGSEDRAVIRRSIASAMRRQPDIPTSAWRLIMDLLRLRQFGRIESEFIFRFQQLTGPVMAKGVEDTTFYCFNRLISLNEVGGNPGEFGTSPDTFHAFCRDIQSQWPQTMLTTATHDTKRGEDTRLKIDLLSEIPKQWIDAVRHWSRMNAHFRSNGFPDTNLEYLMYQTLVGAWPIESDRLVPVMLKSAKEAKMNTSWTDPSPIYESALKTFVKKVMGHAAFTVDLSAFLEPLAWPAVVTSLSQTLIKCTAPGVPDIYQGTELWDRNLVDPDNRRPVDFDRRRQLLAELDELSVAEILKRHAEGLPKLFLMKNVLSTRRHYSKAFGTEGAYRPLYAQGMCADHLVAFMRGGQVVTLAPRLVVSLNSDWKNTTIELPAGHWKNVLSGDYFGGGKRKLSQMLAPFPVALLVREGVIP
jgi:(1->4)-alpha-D-glucan 1-alpha-D-glucosylmutase